MTTPHIIYRATSPSGRCYVGMTCLSVKERWRYHQRAALKSGKMDKHPLSAAIRKYGAENFKLEVLERCASFEDARAAEIRQIAEHRQKGRPYNVSPGGEGDIKTAHVRLKELMTDSVWFAEYRARLSEGIRNSEAAKAHLATLAARTKLWRDQNPEEATVLSQKGLKAADLWHQQNPEKSREMKSRIFKEWRKRHPEEARKAGETSAEAVKQKWLQMPLEERERHSAKRRSSAKRQWAAYTEEDKKRLNEKIAKSLKTRNAGRTSEQRAVEEARLAKARENIDHSYRKQRQKEALKAYWTPERRALQSEAQKNRWRSKELLEPTI